MRPRRSAAAAATAAAAAAAAVVDALEAMAATRHEQRSGRMPKTNVSRLLYFVHAPPHLYHVVLPAR